MYEIRASPRLKASRGLFLFELVTRYDISVDQFFFSKKNIEKTSQRLQLDSPLDTLSESGLRIITATVKEMAEVEKEQSN